MSTAKNYVDMPYEVFVRIFEFLPLEDRKNVRLTCKSWYYCSTSTFITKKEKFVFRSGYSIQDIATTLFKANSFQMSLEFQGLPVGSLPAHIWKVCGHRIHSLEFHDCRWTDKTIKNIILHCGNLASFKINTSFCAAGHNLGNILCSPRVLNELVKKGFRQTKLHTFTIFIDDLHLPESVLKNIFLIYPAIKHFNTGTSSYEDSFAYCLVLHSRREPVFSRPDTCLHSSTRLESLTFNLPTDGKWMKSCISKSDERFRLKQFETMIIYNASLRKTLFDFFTIQNNLNVIRLSLGDPNDEVVKNLTFHILGSCPNLQEFRFKFEPYNLNINEDEFPRFLASISKLQYLSINFNVNATITDKMFESLSPKNLALSALKLEHYEMNDDLCRNFLRHCPSLKHLELNFIVDRTLQIIFEYLVNLETLVLNDVEGCTDYGFTGQDLSQGIEGGYSIKRLQQLKHLDICGYPEMITEKSMLELQLPHLKSFVFNIGSFATLSEETLARVASNLPELTFLAVDGIVGEMSTDKAVKFCKCFKKLHRLICLESYFGGDFFNEYEDELALFFAACPSLRYISDPEFNTYFFNPFTRKVLCKRSSSFKFRGNIFDTELFYVF